MKRMIAVLMVCFALPLISQSGPGRQDPWVYGSHYRWDPSWNQRPNPNRGACFFTTAQFQGNRFCVRSGDKLPSLPENFGDNISSIRTYGGARVRIFNDRGFTGGMTTIARSVDDLRRVPFRGGHTWNNRISSLTVF